MLRAVFARLKTYRSGCPVTGRLGPVALTGPARVEFADNFVLDVRWMFRLGEFFIIRGAHVSVEWELFTIVIRGWFDLTWKEVPKGNGYRWGWKPSLIMFGELPC